MQHQFPRCRHCREPRHRGVYHCRSPKLLGDRLVTPDVCLSCPFRDHPCADADTLSASGVHPGMPAEELAALVEGPPLAWPPGWEDWPVTRRAHHLASERFLAGLLSYPENRYQGRGIVIAGGGPRYFPSLYVTVRAIRAVGCALPVQVWYLGRDDEMPPRYAEILAPLGVDCVDADGVRQRYPCRILNGWELKVFASLHSPFEEVLLLDADCYPVRDPAFLFDDPGYRRTGGLFWPDLADAPGLDWRAFQVTPSGRASIESGQVVVHKRTCWQPLNLAWWYNDHSDWCYLHGYGDKHTFEVAWTRCGFDIHRFSEIPVWSQHSFLHPGPDGGVLFVHRCRDKFRFDPAGYLTGQNFAANHFHAELPLERECFEWLAELARVLAVSTELLPMQESPTQRTTSNDRVPTIRVWMYSCSERRAVLEQTLARWRATGWGEDPVVVWDDQGGPTSSARLLGAARRMLEQAADQAADFYLFLEDDLLFNLFLRENLQHWPPLRDGWLWMGSLYNPALPPRAGVNLYDGWSDRYVLLDHGGYYGTQAVILSRAALAVVLREWDEPGPYDLKLAAIARRHAPGIVAHSPSLVQHVPVASTVGSISHRAHDFDPFFRCLPAVEPPAPPDCGVVTAVGESYFVGFRLLAQSLAGRIPLTVFDAGLNPRQRRFAQEHARVLDLPPLLFPPAGDRRMWVSWNKPLFLLNSPYKYTLWIDSDCLVTGDLSPLFHLIAGAGPVVVSHWDYADYPGGNREELYEREPCSRFAPHMTINAGVIGCGPDLASRNLLHAWAYLIGRAGCDEEIRSLIGWFDEGALLWAMQKAEVPHGWHDRRAWNCLHCLTHTTSSGEFFDRLGVHPGDVIVHVGGQPKYWQHWSDKGAFDV
jgi:hypothetical protein